MKETNVPETCVHIKDNNNSPHVSLIDFYCHFLANFQI